MEEGDPQLQEVYVPAAEEASDDGPTVTTLSGVTSRMRRAAVGPSLSFRLTGGPVESQLCHAIQPGRGTGPVETHTVYARI